MSIRIVTHCYSQKLTQYAKALRYQLASLVHHPCRERVAVTVFFVWTDKETIRVIDDFRQFSNFQLQPFEVNPSEMSRRAIGRNLAALRSDEDVIWFTDCDHCFGQNCLNSAIDSIQKQNGPEKLFYAEHIWMDTDRSIGESSIAQQLPKVPPPLQTKDFYKRRYRRPIGGVQLVRGSYAREFGYCRGSKRYQVPNPKGIMANFRDDVAFRNACKRNGGIKPIPIDNLFRIRHVLKTY